MTVEINAKVQLPDYARDAEKLIEEFKALGMDENTAVKSAIKTLSFALECGLYPSKKPDIQKQRNYLTGIGKVTRNQSNV